MWRLVSDGGFLMINETPNVYFPKEVHTTNLWFNQFIPESLAYRRAIYHKRFAQDQKSWKSSGWRGLGTLRSLEQFQGFNLYQSGLGYAIEFFLQLGYLPQYVIHIPLGYLEKI